MLAARFNTAKRTIIDHYTYVLAGDGCLEEGVSAEASSLAGHLALGKLIVFYDSNKITIDGSTDLAFSEDSGKRYEGYGWQVLRGDMYDFDGLERLVAQAKAEKSRPSLIILKSVIGKGSPGKQGTAGVHGSALGEDELAKTKAAIGAPAGQKFWVDPAAYSFYEKRRPELAKARAAWKAEFESWKAEEPALAAELEDYLAGRARKPLDLPAFAKGEKIATRNASGKVLAAVSKSWTNLVGGSADLTGPNVTAFPDGGDYGPANRAGRYLHFGVREHGMAAIANGISIHGGLRPFVATFLVFADYLPAGPPPGRHHEAAGDLRAHPRLDLHRRRRPHAPAHRAPGKPPRDPQRPGPQARRRPGDGGGLAHGDGEDGRPDRNRPEPAEPASLRKSGSRVGALHGLGRVRSKKYRSGPGHRPRRHRL